MKNWTWSREQKSIVCAVEMTYLRGACGVTRWDCVSNENVYERCGLTVCGSGVGFSVVELVKMSTLRWFGHREDGNKEFVKACLSNVEGPNRRGRPLGRWEDRVKGYLSERGMRENDLEWARRECMDRDRWRSFCHGHLGGHSWREQGIGRID